MFRLNKALYCQQHFKQSRRFHCIAATNKYNTIQLTKQL